MDQQALRHSQLKRDPLMDFSHSPHTLTLGQEARAFGQDTLSIGTKVRDQDGPDATPNWRDLWSKAAQFGLLGLAIPKEFGGKGHDIQTTVHILKELGYGCTDAGLALGLSAQIWSMQMPILEFGSDAQKARYLPDMISGKTICAHAVTEESSGSDAMSLTTTATPTEGGFLLNGTKTYIGMAPTCDLAFVFATSNPEHGAWGISAFLVDAHSKGVIRGEPLEKTGARSLPFGTLTFKDCFVPTDALLGKKGSGNTIFNRSLEWERRFIFAPQVGAMARQLDECIAYSKEREVFGQAIANHQSVANRLAEMKLRLETSELMLAKAAWEADRGISNMPQAAATKLHISESFLASSLDAMRTFAARGYLQGSEPDRNLRDALGGITYGGTSDIQRQIIAAGLTRA